MADPKLSDMLTTERRTLLKNSQDQSLEKDPFELALDKSIKEQVDARIKDENPLENQLIPPQIRRAKLEEEIRKELKSYELEKQVNAALSILVYEGQNYLSNEQHTKLIDDLGVLLHQLDSLDLSIINSGVLKTALSVPQETIALILRIAIDKFNQKLLLDSLAIFTFLSILKDDEPDYIYRVGLVSQECERFEQAIEAYQAAKLLAPEFIGSHIFSAQCYLKIGKRDSALEEVAKAKVILKSIEFPEFWRKHITDIEVLLASAA
jgi:tetratricopeptide (TPR) repeat protein